MLILLFFAFISGLVTILAPCIWPLLPIILSSTVTGEKRKPLGITLGIMLSFGIFTLSISYLVSIFHFDPDILRLFAVIIIGFLGITLVIPALTGILEVFVSRLTAVYGSRLTGQQSHGFHGGFVTGLALGIVWSPCAGPILATIATLAATRTVNVEIILVTIAYIIGVGIPLFLFATAGSALFSKSRALSPYTARIQQVFGVLMILTALAIYTNYDKVLQAKLLDAFPAYSTFLYDLESNEEVQKQLNQIKNMKEDMEEDMKNQTTRSNQSWLKNFGKAPEFVGISNWINSPNPTGYTLTNLRGRVVLVDFWTYTCINCIRTLPHVTRWYNTYKDSGFIVIGVHTPEFEFEKTTENVEKAIDQYGITYPVAQDNDYATWNAYNNHYWPAKYLIDKDGNIRYSHFGEGKYEETEKAIQDLLMEAGMAMDIAPTPLPDETPKGTLTAETYLGTLRRDRFTQSTTNIPLHYFSVTGDWKFMDEHAIAPKNASLTMHFLAKKVFLVITPRVKRDTIRVLLDGQLVTIDNAGVDVKDGVVTLDEPRLYHLIDIKGEKEDHILELQFDSDDTVLYAFTFG